MSKPSNQNNKVAQKLNSVSKNATQNSIAKEKISQLTRSRGFKFLLITLLVISMFAILTLINNLKNDDNVMISYSRSSSNSKNSKNSKSSTAKGSSGKSSTNKANSSKNPKDAKKDANKDGAKHSSDDPDNPNNPDSPIYGNFMGNTPSNIVNEGFLSAQDDYIYYRDTVNGNSLTKKNIKTDEIKTLMDKEISSINVLGGTIYMSLDRYGFRAVQIDSQGSVIKESSIGCNYITAYREHIITSDDNGIYKLNTENNYKEVIHTGKITSCTSYEGHIYFIEEGKLKMLDEQGKEEQEIDSGISSYSVGDDGVYYIKGGKIHKDLEGEIGGGIRAISINVHKGVVYYGNADDSGKLYCADLEGKGSAKMSDLEAHKICVSDSTLAVKNDNVVTLIDR